MNQECLKDKPQGMFENSPSSSETKAAESVMVNENVMDSTPEKSVDGSQRTNTQELMAAIEDDTDELSSRSVLLKHRLSLASVQLAVSNPEAELVVPTSHNLVKDIASTAVSEENTKTMEKTLICTPTSELKEHSSVANLAKVEAECWKEIHQSKDDEKGSLKKEVQGANLHGNFFEYNTENNSAEEEMEITKAGCVSVDHCVSITPEKLLDDSTQLESEEAGGSSKKMKTVNLQCVKEKPQGMAEEDSPSTYETKATEPVMIFENVVDSTLKSSDDISPRRITQELDSELMEGEREEKHEQDTVLVAEIKEEKEASSLSVLLIERSEVSNPEVELFVEATPPPASVQLEVSNHEVELGVPTAHILVKDIASTVIANEDIKTKEKIQSVAKLVEAEAMENLAECWKEIHSNKDYEKGSLEKKIQAENLHGNFSEHNTENSKVGCITVGHSGNLESLDEVKDDSLEKIEQIISCVSGFRLNELELRRWSSTDFTSFSPKEDNTVSKCFKEDEIKSLPQPLPRNKDVTVFDESAIFTTLERNLMLKEHVSENGKTPAADSVTQHKDEAVDEAGKEEDDTYTDFPDESDVPNTIDRYSMLEGSRQNEARNEGESKVIELHNESHIATSLVRKFSLGGRDEENRTFELQRESGTCTSPERHELFGSFGKDKARGSEGKTVVQFYEESGYSTRRCRDQLLADSEQGEAGWQEISSADKSGLFTSLETQLLYGDSEQKKAVKTGEKADAEFRDESDVPNIPERQPFTEDFELDEAAKSEEDKVVRLQVDCGIFTSAEKHLLLETDEEMKGSQYQNHYSSSPKFDLKDDSMVRESHVAALGFRDNIIADSSDSMVSKVSYNQEFNAGQETSDAELIKKSSQAEDVQGLDATQGKSEKKSERSPHFDSVNFVDIDFEEAETIMEAERNVSCSSYVQALPIEEESGSSTNVQNQIHDAQVKLAITDNNETNELIEAKVTKNIEKGHEGNLLLNSSGGTENELLGFDSEVDFEKSCPKFFEDEAAASIATAFGNSISLTSDELDIQNNMNKKDEEMIRRETTPSPKETLNESCGNNKEYLNIDESGTSSEKQVKGKPILVYRTQVKLKRHDMKENAPNSKIVDNLNVTAPRTSKRLPLQDLRKT